MIICFLNLYFHFFISLNHLILLLSLQSLQKSFKFLLNPPVNKLCVFCKHVSRSVIYIFLPSQFAFWKTNESPFSDVQWIACMFSHTSLYCPFIIFILLLTIHKSRSHIKMSHFLMKIANFDWTSQPTKHYYNILCVLHTHRLWMGKSEIALTVLVP